MSSDEAPHKWFGSSDKLLQVPAIKIAGLNNALNVTAGAGNPAILILVLLSRWFMLTFTRQNGGGKATEHVAVPVESFTVTWFKPEEPPKLPGNTLKKPEELEQAVESYIPSQPCGGRVLCSPWTLLSGGCWVWVPSLQDGEHPDGQAANKVWKIMQGDIACRISFALLICFSVKILGVRMKAGCNAAG